MKHQTKLFVIFILIVLAFMLRLGYTSENDFIDSHENIHYDAFKFFTKEYQESKLYNSRGESYCLFPMPSMVYQGINYNVKKFEVRGQSVLNFRRKSFSVETFKGIPVFNGDSAKILNYTHFKLLGLQYDYTYIENRLSQKLLKKIKLWHLNSGFTELFINNNHQGLYLLIEDPVQFAFKNRGASFVLRRGYDHRVESYKVNTRKNQHQPEDYLELFEELYQHIVTFKDKILYKKLTSVFNLENYMRKMAMDILLCNGDYADEIFFFSKDRKDGSVYFDIIPWDYDDIFQSKPHEVGRNWNGTCFGPRYYETHEDVLKVLNGRLVFSIEDDLDYIIAKDDYLYSRYLDILEKVLSKITVQVIENSFVELRNELTPYYQIAEVIEQSQYDKSKTSYELFDSNLTEKSDFLRERITWLNEQVQLQKNSDLYRVK